MIPSGYDAITLNHWLWFKYQCHECPPSEFQRLFENVMKRSRPEFMQIRSYGNTGDRKCDGLFRADGTVFQVYSPDELKLAKLAAKIEEDCDGAIANWKDELKEWVFVYNVRRGLPPDIAKILEKQRAKHSGVAIDHLSSDGLWEITRSLTLQQRAEVLGAPNGYEHLFFAAGMSDMDITKTVNNSRVVLIQDLMSPVNLQAVSAAMQPTMPLGAPLWVRPAVADLPWDAAASEQTDILNEAIQRGREVLPRFAVFSFAQIPLALHLGFVLSDRVEVECYQFDRERKTWDWPDGKVEADLDIRVKGAPSRKVNKTGAAVIRVSLSSTISADDTRAVTRGAVEIDISVAKPNVMWLRSAAQLLELGNRFRDVLLAIRDHMPGCERIHLFYAGPTGGAVTIGQQINPRMNPPIETYQYSQQSSPRYLHALTLRDTPTAGIRDARAVTDGRNGTTSAELGSASKDGSKTGQVVIQFVAGDRGGGPRSLIQAPREESKIREAISGGLMRDRFEFAAPKYGAGIDDVIACQQAAPVILHFVGHGEERQMVLMRDRDVLVETLALNAGQVETLFRNFSPKIRLVFFNTCQSFELARHVTDCGVVEMALGIEQGIPDEYAVSFAATFYRQLSDGRSVRVAFDMAGLHLNSLPATSRPQLCTAASVDADKVIFAARA